MKTEIVRVAAIAVVCIYMFASGSVSPVSASQVTEGLKATVNEVIDIVKNDKFKTDKKLRREILRKTIDKRFSYEQMTIRSMATNWKERTPEEQKEFIELFSKLLENSYATKIESYQNEPIKYTDEMIRDGYAMVKTEIVRKDGAVGVDYKLLKVGDEWKVYDFIIEGVSMVNNYRAQFNKIIKKESYDGLKKKMLTKISDLESSDAPDKEKKADDL